MNKPEVVAWMVAELREVTMHEVSVMDWDDEGEDVDALIRLTDHEAAMAKADAEEAYWRKQCQALIDQTTPLEPVPGDPMWSRRIQLDPVTAERNELLGLLREARTDMREWGQAFPRAGETTRQLVARIDAALAKMGAKS